MTTFQMFMLCVTAVMLAEIITVNCAKMVQVIVESRRDSSK
jgi:hypothetical protein